MALQAVIGRVVLVGLKGVASVRTAAASAVAAATVYAAMWLGFRQGWGWLQAADSSCLRLLHDVGVKHPLWVRFWELFSVVFSPGTFRLLALGAAVILLSRRRRPAALLMVISVELSELVSLAAKGLANRPRPPTALVHASSSAFPSGHALCSTVGVLALLTVLAPLTRRSSAVIAVVVGALVVLAVGFARVALNVHHPSDVVAGWALGYLYFALCWAVDFGQNAGNKYFRLVDDRKPVRIARRCPLGSHRVSADLAYGRRGREALGLHTRFPCDICVQIVFVGQRRGDFIKPKPRFLL